jgi:hypothetical protein
MSMSDDTTTADVGETADAGQQEQGQPQAHHSARQPRDDAKRFAGAPTPQEPAEPRKLRLKFRENGQEREEELTEEQAAEEIRRARWYKHKEKAADQRMSRADEIAKGSEEARKVAEALAKGDYSTLKGYFQKHGRQPVEALSLALDQALQEAEMDPKDLEIATLKAEKEAAEAARKELETKQQDADRQRQIEAMRPKVMAAINAALERPDLPKTPELVQTVAQIKIESMEAGAPLSDEDAAEFAKWQFVESQAPMMNSLTPEQFEKHFESLAKAYHAHLIKKAKAIHRGGGQKPAPKPRESEPVNGKEPEVQVYNPYDRGSAFRSH